MVFRNYLNMSVLLVLGFFCLHFWEVSVHKKLVVYEHAMEDVIERRKQEIYSGISLCKSELDRDGIPYHKLKELESDFIRFKENTSIQSRHSDVNEIRAEYDLASLGNIDDRDVSVIEQNAFYEKVMDRLNEFILRVGVKRELREANNRHVIIKNRKAVYEIGKEYALEFEDVSLGQWLGRDFELYIEANGKKERLVQFPYTLRDDVDTIAFFMNGINPISGEKYILKEVYSLKP